MASWMEERDRLVAQTLAFVQQVAAARPTTPVAAAPVAVAPVDGNNAFSEETTAASQMAGSDVPAPSAPTAAATQQIATPVSPPVAATAEPLAVLSERDEIMRRVAAFRAQQGRIIAERDAYYEAVKDKIKTSLGNESGDGRL